LSELTCKLGWKTIWTSFVDIPYIVWVTCEARLLSELTCKLGWKAMWTSFVDSYNYGISTPGRGYWRLEGRKDDQNMETSSLR
jgi:hypothetical protein